MTVVDEGVTMRVVVVGGRKVEDVRALVERMPADSNLAVLVAAPDIDAAELRSTSPVPVIVVEQRARIAPNTVFLLPMQRGVTIADGELVVERGRSPAAPIDAIMRAVADEIGPSGVGVLLAGHGTEGMLGIKRIKEAGGLTIAQLIAGEGDGSGMPDAAIATGFVDAVAPLDSIISKILDVATDDVPDDFESRSRTTSDIVADTLRDILTLIRLRTGHDFSAYKRATLFRRISRRSQLCGCDSIGTYLRYLREHPQELTSLLRDFLISVTSFFRDPPAYEALAREVIPTLFAHGPGDSVRVWVAGCATGEEAYSVAILLLEHARTLAAAPHIQVFATDIDENALAEARQGWYPDSIVADVSPDRLERFFVRENGKYRVAKEVRELVLFSPHNLLRDPPYSRLDLVTCRNLLIYLERTAQDHVLTMFHFGLRPDRVLFLGSSESAEGSNLFAPLEPRHRLFSRRGSAGASLGEALAANAGPGVRPRWTQQRSIPAFTTPEPAPLTLGELHHRTVEQYAPPSVLVDVELQIEHMSEHAGRFLRHQGGAPTREILQLVMPELRLDLRSAIHRARQEGVDRRVVRFADDGVSRAVELRVRSIRDGHHSGALLVFFDELAPAGDDPSVAGTGIEPIVREIEADLHRTRDQLRTTIEQYETSLEELKASNEELHAINEELRSATEELETSKEELQSVNEELTTLNHELKVTVNEVSRANSDLENLMTSTQIGVVFLDRELNIMRFTPRIQDLFHIIPSDIGRPLTDLTHRLGDVDLAKTARSVMDTLHVVERELASRDGKWYLARWLPYRSIEDRIEGVVITFVDITDLRDAVEARRRTEAALIQVEERLRVALRVAPIAIVSFDTGFRATWAYLGGRELDGADDWSSFFASGHAERLVTIAREVSALRSGRRAELDVRDGAAPRTFDFRIEPNTMGVTAVGFDITPSKQAEASLREADRRKDEFLATLSHELRNPLAPLKIAIDVARLVDADPAKRAHSLTVMERQVAMLSELVDELLDLSRITQGKVEFETRTVELSRVIDAAIEATRGMISGSGHELRMHVPGQPVYIDGDERRLVQIFTNLLGNAAKYTPPGGHIDLDIAADHSRGRVHIRVTDDGVGISPELLHHIFDIFVQSRDARGRSQGGLGIGLSVVRKLVELHGGEVEAFSAGTGTGSTFVVHLPIRKEP